MVKWGYSKGQGRWYKRATGTRRFPDSGVVKSDGRKVGSEITSKHAYGQDKGKIKKKFSKIYKSHPVRGKRKNRGGYRRKLR